MARLNLQAARSQSNDSLYRVTPQPNGQQAGVVSPALSFSSEKENSREHQIANGKAKAKAMTTANRPEDALRQVGGQNGNKRRRLESLDGRRAAQAHKNRKSIRAQHDDDEGEESEEQDEDESTQFYDPEQDIAKKQKIRLAINKNLTELTGELSRRREGLKGD
jgi:hypothetical protein